MGPGPRGATETDGCEADTLPEGTPVEVDGATRPGTMVYSSWVRMQQSGESDPQTCQYNDFALVRIDPADHGRVNPTVPFFGGPPGSGRPRRCSSRCTATATRRCGSACRPSVPSGA